MCTIQHNTQTNQGDVNGYQRPYLYVRCMFRAWRTFSIGDAMNLEINSKVVQAFVDGDYPVKDKAFWEAHMTDKHFVMGLLRAISENYYSFDPVVCELLDKVEAHVYKGVK